MKNTVFVVFLACAVNPTAIAQVVNPANGHVYYLSPNMMTALEGQAWANSLGGHLVTVNDAAEQTWLQSALQLNCSLHYWCGLTDSEDFGASEGNWRWMSGDPVSYFNWYQGEPNNSNDEDFVLIGHFSSCQWNDVDFDYGLFPAIAEVVPVTCHASTVAHWSFNHSAIAACGAPAFNGELFDAATLVHSGLPSVIGNVGCLSLPAPPSRIELPDAPSNTVPLAEGTLQAWVYVTETDTQDGWPYFIYNEGSPGSHTDLAAWILPPGNPPGMQTFRTQLWIDNGGSPPVMLPDFDLFQWHHLAWSWDGVYHRYYMDGMLIFEYPSGNTPPFIGGEAMIGSDDQEQGFFIGRLDEIRLSNVALPPEQLANGFFAPPGYESPPAEPQYSPPPQPQPMERNLIVVTHGWNTTQEEFDSIWQPIANNVALLLEDQPSWVVYALNWASRSGNVWTGPGLALNNGINEGVVLGRAIAQADYDHVHLIGHSAGAALLAAASYWVKQNSPGTTIHLTFLDAYAGALVGPWGDYQHAYGGYAEWSDHYYSTEYFGICDGEVRTGPFTQLFLPQCFNVDVSLTDPDFGLLCLSSHSWPYCFYSATSGADAVGECIAPIATEDLGYPLSYESVGGEFSSWLASVQTQYATGQVRFVDPNSRTELTEANADIVYRRRTHSPVDLTTLSFSSSGEPTLIVTKEGFTATTMTTEESAWITVSLELSDPANFVQFDVDFADGEDTHGLLTIYADGEDAGFLDEPYVDDAPERYGMQFGDLSPGIHTLSFRLDQLSVASSSVSVTEIATGYGAFVPLADLNVDGVVNVFDLLDLLAAWGDCDAPCPPSCTADLTSIDGTGTDCTVNVFDLLLLLSNWST